MDQRSFSEAVMQAALQRGVAAETYTQLTGGFDANASEGEIDRYSVSTAGGLSLRVSVEGRSGYAYTERFEDAEALVKHAIDNARAIEETDEHPMGEKSAYRAVGHEANPLTGMSAEEKIALALELEKKTLAIDPRVKRMIYCEVETGAEEMHILNTNGLDASRASGYGVIYVYPAVEENGELQTALAFRTGADALDLDGCAKEAVQRALDKLGAEPVDSGRYRVLIENYAMCDLLAAFSPMFSAAEAQKGCSLLADRVGETIAASCVSITDDPFHPIMPRAFDDEGTPCEKKRVVDGGRLTTLLHNLKTAKKAGVSSTGNAAKASAASPVDVAPAVFYLEPGEGDFDALVKQLGDGLIVTELDGLHAGLSCISGDFSLKAQGKLVEGGRVVRAVSGVTVAGNFLDLLRGVEAVGADLRFGMPRRVCTTGSPSVLAGGLAVAGK